VSASGPSLVYCARCPVGRAGLRRCEMSRRLRSHFSPDFRTQDAHLSFDTLPGQPCFLIGISSLLARIRIFKPQKHSLAGFQRGSSFLLLSLLSTEYPRSDDTTVRLVLPHKTGMYEAQGRRCTGKTRSAGASNVHQDSSCICGTPFDSGAGYTSCACFSSIPRKL
jgi:hypothetical protein